MPPKKGQAAGEAADNLAAMNYVHGLDGYSFASESVVPMGHRAADGKSYYALKNSKDEPRLMALVTVQPKGDGLKWPGKKKGKKKEKGEDALSSIDIVKSFFQAVQGHPFVCAPVELPELHSDDSGTMRVMLIRPFFERGSLKDKIYGKKKSDIRQSYHEKYIGRPGTPLGEPEIALFGRQILEALVMFNGTGLSAVHASTANVMLDYSDRNNPCCKLADFEGALLGLKPFYYNSFAAYPQVEQDVLCFGHILYEMAMGYNFGYERLPSVLQGCPKAINTVLQRIFNPKTGAGSGTVSTLSLDDLLQMAPFASANLNQPSMKKVHVDPAVKTAIRKLRKADEKKDDVSDAVAAVEKPEKKKKKKGGKREEDLELGVVDDRVAGSSWGAESPDEPWRQYANVIALFTVILSVSSLSQTFFSIGPTAQAFYRASRVQMQLCWGIFPLVHVLATPLAMWALDVKGLRFGVSVASFVVLLGASVRCIYGWNEHGYAWLIAGQVIAAVGRPIAFCAVPKLACRWFNHKQRWLITSIGYSGHVAGVVLAMLFKLLVETAATASAPRHAPRHAPVHHRGRDQNGNLPGPMVDGMGDGKFDADHMDADDTRMDYDTGEGTGEGEGARRLLGLAEMGGDGTGIFHLLVGQAALALIGFLLVMALFKGEPMTFPEPSAAEQRPDIEKTVKASASNIAYIVLCVAMLCLGGMIWGAETFVDRMMRVLEYKPEQSWALLLALQAFGIVSIVAAGWLVCKYPKFKIWISGLGVVAGGSMAGLVFALHKHNLPTISLMGVLFLVLAQPLLPLCMHASVEMQHPALEATVVAVPLALANIGTLVYFFVGLDETTTKTSFVLGAGCCTGALLLVLAYWPAFARYQADSEHENPETQSLLKTKKTEMEPPE